MRLLPCRQARFSLKNSLNLQLSATEWPLYCRQLEKQGEGYIPPDSSLLTRDEKWLLFAPVWLSLEGLDSLRDEISAFFAPVYGFGWRPG